MDKELTSEEKLKAIIKEQVNGGYKRFEDYLQSDAYIFCDTTCSIMYSGDSGWFDTQILHILLDTSGLKAAYPGMVTAHFGIGTVPSPRERWMDVAQKIHDVWHSKEGNNYQLAIDTAHRLLP